MSDSSRFITDKLMQGKYLSSLAEEGKRQGWEFWIAGGAITTLATTGSVEDINDYDLYFSSPKAASEAIAHLKDHSCHCAFISDKSITFVPDDSTTLQFIYYNYYDSAEDIFKEFDFSINCAAYNPVKDDFTTHEDFWMHCSQRRLIFNTGTLFPIISSLRVSKYLDRGYNISRKEMVKIGLAVSTLNINTWEEFFAQVGNLYGMSIVNSLKDDTLEFNLADAMALLDDPIASQEPSEPYKHPYEVIEYFVLGEPIKYVIYNDKKIYFGVDINGNIEDYVDNGVLSDVEIPLEEYLGEYLYRGVEMSTVVFLNEEVVAKSKPRYNRPVSFSVQRKETLSTNNLRQDCILVKCKYNIEDVVEIDMYGDVFVSKLTPVEIIGDRSGMCAYLQGKEVPDYIPPAGRSNKSGSYRGGNKEGSSEYFVAKFKEDIIRKYTKSTGGKVKYARNTFEGIILKGGEDITPFELLAYTDHYNLCFGGEVTITSDGKYYGSYNTD